MFVQHYYYYLIIGLLLRISASGWAEQQIVSDPTMHASATLESNTNQDPIPVTRTKGSSEDQNTSDTCENPQVESVSDDDDDEDDDGERELAEGDEHDDDEEEEEEEDYDAYPLDFNEWGKPQAVRDDAVEERLKMSRKYMFEVIFAGSLEGKYTCRNEHIACTIWSSEGDCEEDHDFMVERCSPACQTCEEYLEKYYDSETDNDEVDEDLPKTEESPTGVKPSLWGVPQREYSTFPAETFQSIVDATHKYMIETVLPQQEVYANVYQECHNKYADCTIWAAKGECDQSPSFMHLYCAPACQTCDQLDYDKRCPTPPEGTEVFRKPGDLNAMFERIVNDPYWKEKHGPLEILSSPGTTGGPWIISLENFVTDEECTRFIELGAEIGYERSEDVADEDLFFGSLDSVQSEGRTSTNAWCMEDCSKDPIVEPVHRRVENLTGFHFNYTEYYQLLRYEPGQFYEEHHDYIGKESNRPQGPRVVTVFMYLNDVEDGGGTHFGRLNLTVQPKKGRVVVWPSVLDEDPVEWDERTHHEALPVKSGIKYGSNAWLHLRDFKTASQNDCV